MDFAVFGVERKYKNVFINRYKVYTICGAIVKPKHISTFLLYSLYTLKKMKKRRYKSTNDPQDSKVNEMKRIFFFFLRVIKLYWLAQSQNTCSFTVTLSQPTKLDWYGMMEEEKQFVTFYTASFYSMVFLFVRVLIQPFLTLTPSTLLPTLALLDLFHLMTWNRCPIRFRHLSETRGFPCSITVLVSLLDFLLKLWSHAMS